jgi:hypothetical protein
VEFRRVQRLRLASGSVDADDRSGLSAFSAYSLLDTSCCLRIGVVSELSLAIETARKCFSIIGNPAVDLVQDPETDASYLVVEIQVRGDVRDNVMAHRNFARETARLLGPRREIISLHYDII